MRVYDIRKTFGKFTGCYNRLFHSFCEKLQVIFCFFPFVLQNIKQINSVVVSAYRKPNELFILQLVHKVKIERRRNLLEHLSPIFEEYIDLIWLVYRGTLGSYG